MFALLFIEIKTGEFFKRTDSVRFFRLVSVLNFFWKNVLFYLVNLKDRKYHFIQFYVSYS